MNSREHFAHVFKDEKPRFLRVLSALPAEKIGYKPHPKSSSAGDIAWLLATELGDACELIDRSEVNWTQKPAPKTLAELVAAYEKNAAALEKRLPKLDEGTWAKKARFLADGKVMWEAPLGEMLWGFLFDAIHHRGQLSAYLRPMGGKVPSIYGPSADDPGT